MRRARNSSRPLRPMLGKNHEASTTRTEVRRVASHETETIGVTFARHMGWPVASRRCRAHPLQNSMIFLIYFYDEPGAFPRHFCSPGVPGMEGVKRKNCEACEAPPNVS
eukprot:scaffold18435_cov113-Isochrysis_galbana.AAC.2